MTTTAGAPTVPESRYADLRGQTAIITGSTSGIGLGLAEAFAAAGCRLVVNGIVPAEGGASLARDLAERHKTDVFFHPADLADPEQCAALVHDAEQRFGSVDILINNAGIQHVAPTEEFPLERWDAILAIDLSAAFYTMRAVLPGMRKRNHGRIVNTASAHGLVASINKSAYVAAKHGLVGLTKVVALETATTGITCNAICPGFALTPLVKRQIDDNRAVSGLSPEEAAREFLRGKHPSGRFTAPEEIAALALFLCSPAARNITGAALSIDGGWTAQ